MRFAFFDLDHTLLRGNSANLFIRYLMKKGELGWTDVAKGLYYTACYRLNMIRIEEVGAKYLMRYRGVPETDLVEQCEEWFSEYVQPTFYSEALELVETHRRQGDRLVLLSASTVYACRPVSRFLRLDDYIGTRLAVEDGKLTGAPEPPVCYGKGKLVQARNYLRQQGRDEEALRQASFYTDSITDLPVLEAVGDPQVVNPDPLLAREAKRRGWPVRHFKR